MKTIIVEDTPDIMDVIENILTTQCPDCQLVGKASQLNEAYDLIKSQKPDLLLLDIQIKGGTSFDLLRRFQENNEPLTANIIFITAHGNFENATKAIKYSALDFITKPINPQELQQAIDRAVSQKLEDHQRQISLLLETMSTDHRHRIAVPMLRGQLEFVDIENLNYIASDQTMAKLYTVDQRMVHSAKPLSYFSKLLIDDYSFFYINGSQIINLAQLKSYEHGPRNVFLHNGTHLKASKRGGQDLKNYWNGIKKLTPQDGSILSFLKNLFH